MIKRCYRLSTMKDFLEDVSGDNFEMFNLLYNIDEDYHTQKEWQEGADYYTNEFNTQFGTSYTSEQFFGKVENADAGGWVYCTKCGESFWADQDHECEV